MKAVELGLEFICFSFVTEDGKRVVNISVFWRLSCFRKLLFFIISSKDISRSRTKWRSCSYCNCLLVFYIALLKINSTEDVALFINSTNTFFWNDWF